MRSLLRLLIRFGLRIRIETSTPTQEPREFLLGRPPPNWLGPVIVTAQESEKGWNPPWSACLFRFVNEDDEIPTTTVGRWSKPYLTASYLLVPGLTTRLNMSNTSHLRYRSGQPYLSRYSSGLSNPLTLRASTASSARVLRVIYATGDGK